MRGLAVALALAGCGAHWTPRDVWLETSSIAMNFVDAHQSESIAAAGLERNPIIGAHGENIDPWTFALTAALLHMLVTDTLPPKWRPVWQGASIALETGVVLDNWSKGWSP